MNAPKNLPAKRYIETEAEDHATETARAVHAGPSPEHHQQHQAESESRSDEPPNARPHEPWQID